VGALHGVRRGLPWPWREETVDNSSRSTDGHSGISVWKWQLSCLTLLTHVPVFIDLGNAVRKNRVDIRYGTGSPGRWSPGWQFWPGRVGPGRVGSGHGSVCQTRCLTGF